MLASGKAVVLPQASQEPLFLDRTGVLKEQKRKKVELSFFCVPVFLDQKTAGTLCLTVPFDRHRDYDRDTKLLQIAASMVGLAMKVARLVAADRQRLVEENQQLRLELRERYDLRHLIGHSHAMQRVYEAVAQAAPSSTTVLIRGESGTGKELVAHALHYNSPRAEKPFIKVSCGALPENLIESELFGYEPGAFTDARHQKKGRFELAHGGTLFLDEVGELSPATQVKLLRVLQEREFERLGGVQPVKVDVRLIAATHRDLEAAVKAGTFREDLYYRLHVFELFMPPLRERQADILLLADHFVEKIAAAQGKDVRRISTSAIDMLVAYHWPGNVRELENAIERAILVSRRWGDPRPPPAALPPDRRSFGNPARGWAGRGGRRLRAGPAPGHPEVGPGEPRPGGPAASDDGTDPELQDQEIRPRARAFQDALSGKTAPWSIKNPTFLNNLFN